MFSRLSRTPLPLVLLVASFLCPTELSLYLGGLRLPPHRVAIIILILPALWRIISHGDTRFRIFDALMYMFGVWLIYVYTIHGEEFDGLIYGTSVSLEALGGYTIARAYVRDFHSFRATLDLLLVACGIALLFALPETLFGQHFTHDFLQSVTGYEHPRKIEMRLMFTRAYGVFDHPIHLGTFAATIFAMVWFSGKRFRQRIKECALVFVTALTALSSAPLLCIFTQLGFIIWDIYTRGLKGRILITCLGIVFLYFAVSMFATRSPIMIIATGFTIDSWTGFYRTQIWQYGMNNVFANPWFGIGLADWERAWWMHSDSIDAYWLVTMLQTGVPSLMILLLAILTIVTGIAKRVPRLRDDDMSRAAKGWVMALIAICLAACTVHFWNVSASYFFFTLGLGGWLADPMPERHRARRAAQRDAKRLRQKAAASVGGGAHQPGGVPTAPAPAFAHPGAFR